MYREVAMRLAHGLEADVWSLGCMLYTMLVGQPPFDTDAVRSTLNRVIQAEYDLPSDLSLEAQDLIQKLLQKNPKQRLHINGVYSYVGKVFPSMLCGFDFIEGIFCWYTQGSH